MPGGPVKNSNISRARRSQRLRTSDKDQPRVARICADCGFKDSSLTPPVMCPKCHNNPDSPLAPINAMKVLNRKQRRAEAVNQRKLQRKVQKQIAAEGGTYEAS